MASPVCGLAGARFMSMARGSSSMRSKVERRMRRETGKTLREIRRARKLRKKLMTDEERLMYNLRRVRPFSTLSINPPPAVEYASRSFRSISRSWMSKICPEEEPRSSENTGLGSSELISFQLPYNFFDKNMHPGSFDRTSRTKRIKRNHGEEPWSSVNTLSVPSFRVSLDSPMVKNIIADSVDHPRSQE